MYIVGTWEHKSFDVVGTPPRDTKKKKKVLRENTRKDGSIMYGTLSYNFKCMVSDTLKDRY